MSGTSREMPVLRAPAFLAPMRITLALALCAAAAFPANAQTVGQGTAVQQLAPGLAPPAVRPVPDQLQLAKLIWSIMAAVDHANRSGNYSVLRDISSTGFQINNDPAKLAQVFSSIRSSRIDLSSALLVPPVYTVAPQLIQEDVFRVQGSFNLRPVAMAFDMYFQWERSEWRLYGIDIRPITMADRLDVPTSP